TPVVAGTMALIKAKYPDLNQRQLLERLLLTADDEGTRGEDLEYGWGVVDPLAALTADVDYYEDPAPTGDASPSGAIAAPGDDGSGIGDYVPVIITGAALTAAVAVAVLLVRSRRRAPARAPAPQQRPAGPPPQAAPDTWRRPPEPGPPPPAR
ncbi:MAG TPA: S8 family serine peptidase, partial [Phytomonospora sp.]